MRQIEIGVEGKSKRFNTLSLDGKEIVLAGRLLRTAKIVDEWYDDVEHPQLLIEQLKKHHERVDIFTFWQRLPDTVPRYDYHLELDSIAALRITTLGDWYKNQLNAKARNLLKKSERLGINVREVEFNDEFLQGMTEIFNESPVRQGKPFWHYGKDVEIIKSEFSRYLFREDLFGAYHRDKLVGFIFLAYAGKYALLGQIISKLEHRDKAPNNALIAKAVEVCGSKRIPYLVYSTWSTGTLGHFKRQNGFERFDLPRYYVPLTVRGSIALKLGLHHGLAGIIPDSLRSRLVSTRKWWYERKANTAPMTTRVSHPLSENQ
jgi:hypothetical protein